MVFIEDENGNEKFVIYGDIVFNEWRGVDMNNLF